MHLDLDGLHGEEPHVPRGLSVGDRVIGTILVHVLIVLAIYYLPRLGFLQPAHELTLPPPAPDQIVRFVSVEPMVDKVAPPAKLHTPSDMDRRSATPEIAPKPKNDDTLSHGNTQEKVVGAPDEQAKGPAQPTPDPPAPPAPQPPTTGTVIPDSTPAPQTPGGGLGESLRNLQKYLQHQTYDNPQGSQNQNSADIQFDSKGVDFGPWLRRFRAQVMSNWLIPQAAMFQSGHVVFQFIVWRDGRITDLHIVQPSKIDAFNLAANSALKLSNPTAALPDAYPTDHVLFTVTFFYNEDIHH